MNLAYAASQSSEHSAENIGDIILHHVKDTNILSIRIGETYFSIFTKHVLMMWIAAALVVFVFRYAFREQHVIPSGVANLPEAIVVFLREGVVLPNIGEAGRRSLTYLLSVFFIILVCDLLDLLPLAT